MTSNAQFSIAVHLMMTPGLNYGKEIISAQMAASVNTSEGFISKGQGSFTTTSGENTLAEVVIDIRKN